MTWYDTLVIGWRDLRDQLERAGVPERAGRDALVLLILTQFCDQQDTGRPALTAHAFGQASIVVREELGISSRAYQGALARLQQRGLFTPLIEDEVMLAAFEDGTPEQVVAAQLGR